ncbi:MAG: hypothetical protein KTR29_00700 [Rhodothermaceae bacterium]|nr:hypothetical protein [Rhodothermaceae bacterium]
MEIYYTQAVALLRTLSTPYGIKASKSHNSNYEAVFTRDAVMAGIAGLIAGIEEVCQSHIYTLEQLRKLQGENGQIASNYTHLSDNLERVSFGTLSPKIDSVTWYIVGVCLYAKNGKINPDAWQQSIERAISLLNTLEYNGRHLIYIPKGGNWADEYIDDGYILYDQILRAWGLTLAGTLYGVKKWTEKATLIWKTIQINYWPKTERSTSPLVYHPTLYARQIATAKTHPYSSFSPSGYRELFDLAACSLLAIASPKYEEIEHTLDWIEATFLNKNLLPPAFSPVIDKGESDWQELSKHYLFSFKNLPYHYHNGGIWWIWLGWLALAMAVNNRTDSFRLLRTICEQAITAENFEFDEYIDGKEHYPGGEKMMAYSASGLLMMNCAEHSTTKERL